MLIARWMLIFVVIVTNNLGSSNCSGSCILISVICLILDVIRLKYISIQVAPLKPQRVQLKPVNLFYERFRIFIALEKQFWILHRIAKLTSVIKLAALYLYRQMRQLLKILHLQVKTHTEKVS